MATYNSYRPKRFDGVVGQGLHPLILRGQIRKGRIHHAYLFNGSSGTGKTTTARVFAMALNCANIKEGEPCGECPSCREIYAGQSWDVSEVDVANLRGIDDVQELKRKAFFLPRGKYKVYILDECHQFTDAAWQALLKLLEEPPPYLVIILTTTEKNKVPETVRSRCADITFTSISEADISARVAAIAKDENLELTLGEMKAILSDARGNMRAAENAYELIRERREALAELKEV